MQVIATSATQESSSKIGNKTSKFENLQELNNFYNEQTNLKPEFYPKIDAKYATNIVRMSYIN